MGAFDELIAQSCLKVGAALVIMANACLSLLAEDGSGWVRSAAVSSIGHALVCMRTPG